MSSIIFFIVINCYAHLWDNCSHVIVNKFLSETKELFHPEKFKMINDLACNEQLQLSFLNQWVVERHNLSSTKEWKQHHCNEVISSNELFSIFFNNIDSNTQKDWIACKKDQNIPYCIFLNPSDGMYELQVDIPLNYVLENLYEVEMDNVLFYTEPNDFILGSQSFFWTTFENNNPAWIEIKPFCRIDTTLAKEWSFTQPICAIVYADISKGGRSLNVYNTSKNNIIPNLSNFGMQNTISSAHVKSGCQLEVFTQNNFKGYSMKLNKDIDDFRLYPIGHDIFNSLRCSCQ